MELGPSCKWFLIEFAEEFSIQYFGDSNTILDDTITGNRVAPHGQV